MEFDIVESTDCSITIEWYIDEQDHFLEYQLDHRLHGTDNWIVNKMCTTDVLTKENGCRMFTLQHLFPDTEFELKLCSLDNHIKSHYSESKIRQTLKLGNILIFIL